MTWTGNTETAGNDPFPFMSSRGNCYPYKGGLAVTRGITAG